MEPSRRAERELERQGRLALWFAVFVGPLAWAVDYALSYSLTQRACAAQSADFLLVFSAIAFAAAVAGLLTALRLNRKLPPTERNSHGRRADPTRFLVLSGIALSTGFLLAILAAAIPRLIIDPCA